MTDKNQKMRSPLGQIRALGAAHAGSEHWWLQRMTSLALIPLTFYPLAAFFVCALDGGYNDMVAWMHKPYAAGSIILFILVSFHHTVAGLQVVIEDYVHSEGFKIASLIVIKFLAVVLTVVGCVATLKIMLGV